MNESERRDGPPVALQASVGLDSPPLVIGIKEEVVREVIELMDHAMAPDVEYETNQLAMADAAIIKMKKLIFNAKELLTSGGWYEASLLRDQMKPNPSFSDGRQDGK